MANWYPISTTTICDNHPVRSKTINLSRHVIRSKTINLSRHVIRAKRYRAVSRLTFLAPAFKSARQGHVMRR
jgi:hypothetical protein